MSIPATNWKQVPPHSSMAAKTMTNWGRYIQKVKSHTNAHMEMIFFKTLYCCKAILINSKVTIVMASSVKLNLCNIFSCQVPIQLSVLKVKINSWTKQAIPSYHKSFLLVLKSRNWVYTPECCNPLYWVVACIPTQNIAYLPLTTLKCIPFVSY